MLSFSSSARVDERDRGRGGRISRSERAAGEASGVIPFECNGVLGSIPSEKRLRERDGECGCDTGKLGKEPASERPGSTMDPERESDGVFDG